MSSSTVRVKDAAAILAGPLIIGVFWGLRPGGDGSAPVQAVHLAAILCGVMPLLIPALYIGAALFGIAPPARSMAESGWEALRSGSIVLFGLAPAFAFLISSEEGGPAAPILLASVVSAAVLLALRDLYLRLFGGSGEHRRSLPLFLAWSAVAIGIAGQLVLENLG